MQLLIPFTLVSLTAHSVAFRDLLGSISQPLGVLRRPMRSISDATKGPLLAYRNAAEDNPGVSETSEIVTSDDNRFVADPVVAAANFGKNVSTAIGSLFENPIGAVASISKSFADTLGGGARSPGGTPGASDNSQSNQGTMAAAEKFSRMIGTVIDEFVGNASKMPSILRQNMANMMGSAVSLSRQQSNDLPDSLKNSTGSVKDAVEELQAAIKEGSTMSILAAAGSAVYEIFGQMITGKLEARDASQKISDVGNVVFEALRQNFLSEILRFSFLNMMSRLTPVRGPKRALSAQAG